MNTPKTSIPSAIARRGREIATIAADPSRAERTRRGEAAGVLFEVARRLDDGATVRETPASRHHSISDAFGSWYEGITWSGRQRVVWRAANRELCDKTEGWLRPRTIRGHESPDRLVMAVESDEVLAERAARVGRIPEATGGAY